MSDTVRHEKSDRKPRSFDDFVANVLVPYVQGEEPEVEVTLTFAEADDSEFAEPERPKPKPKAHRADPSLVRPYIETTEPLMQRIEVSDEVKAELLRRVLS